MEVAVLGGGHGCYAAAVHLSEQGHRVRFWRRDRAAFAPVLDSGVVRVKDFRGERDVSVALPTTDLATAVAGAELIVIPLPSLSHEALSEQLAPVLEDGQVVFLPPGTFGSFLFARALNRSGNLAKVSFAETGTLPYLAQLLVAMPPAYLPVCFPPATAKWRWRLLPRRTRSSPARMG